MKQKKICVDRFAEYPGAYAWPTFQVECPEYHQMVSEYGDVSQTDSYSAFPQIGQK